MWHFHLLWGSVIWGSRRTEPLLLTEEIWPSQGKIEQYGLRYSYFKHLPVCLNKYPRNIYHEDSTINKLWWSYSTYAFHLCFRCLALWVVHISQAFAVLCELPLSLSSSLWRYSFSIILCFTSWAKKKEKCQQHKQRGFWGLFLFI